jgi:hypothetical protein
VTRALETLNHLLLSRAYFCVGNHLHHCIEVSQVSVGEIGDIGTMIKVNRLRRERLAGKIDIVRA